MVAVAALGLALSLVVVAIMKASLLACMNIKAISHGQFKDFLLFWSPGMWL